MNDAWKNILMVAALITPIVIFVVSFGRTACWDVDIDIAYVYEGETEIHHIQTTEPLRYKNSVKTVEPVFTAPAGYDNTLTLYCVVYRNGKTGFPTVRNRELMCVPDRRFRVENITWTTSERRLEGI